MTQPPDPYAPPPSDPWAAPSPAGQPAGPPDAYQGGYVAAPAGSGSGLPVPPAWQPGPAPFARVRGLGYAVVAVACAWLLTRLAMAVAAYPAGEGNAEAAERGQLAPFFLYDGLGLLLSLITVSAFVLGGLWLTAVRRNVDRVDRASQRRGVVWAWLGWVVPVVSLWFPYQVVADAGRASGRRELPYGWWWGTWLLLLVVDTLPGISTFNDLDGVMDPALARLLGPFETLAAIATIPPFVLWVVIVLGVSAAQHEWAEGRGPAVPPPSQGYPAQGYPAQAYPPAQAYSAQAYPAQAYPAQGYPPAQAYPPPQGYSAQGYPAQAYPPAQGYAVPPVSGESPHGGTGATGAWPAPPPADPPPDQPQQPPR